MRNLPKTDHAKILSGLRQIIMFLVFACRPKLNGYLSLVLILIALQGDTLIL